MTSAQTPPSRRYRLDDLILDTGQRRLWRGDEEIHLSKLSFDFLRALVEAAPNLLTHDQLAETVWGPRRVVTPENVSQRLKMLRQALGEHAEQPRYFEAVRGQGYRLMAQVVEAQPSTNDARPRTSAHGADRVARGTGRKVAYLVSPILVLAVAFLAIDSYWLKPGDTTSAHEPQTTISRIAVLPCDDLSPDPNNSYFAPSIHVELLNHLAKLRNLRVVARASVLQYAMNRPPIPRIAADLDIDTVMECSIRYADNQVLLTAELIDASINVQIWSDRYLVHMSDLPSLFAAQADIAMSVADAVRIELFEEEREQIEQAPTESRDAYELYLASGASPDFDRALSLVEQALAHDDQFVEAWIRQADLHSIIAGFRVGDEADVQRAEAIRAARRAVALAPRAASAHRALATHLGQSGYWIDAELAWGRALELGDPGVGVAMLKMSVGHYADAVAMLEGQLLVNPLGGAARGLLLVAYEVLGDAEARRRHWERGELLHNHRWFGQSVMEPVLRLGENDTEFLLTQAPDTTVWNVGVANLDSPTGGLAAMRALYSEPEIRNAVDLRFMAAWAMYFGDPTLALRWFREAVELQATTMLTAWLPIYADLRREQGFQDLLRELALPDYWNRFGWPEFCRPLENDHFECD